MVGLMGDSLSRFLRSIPPILCIKVYDFVIFYDVISFTWHWIGFGRLHLQPLSTQFEVCMGYHEFVCLLSYFLPFFP